MANIYFGAYDYTSLPAFTNDWNTVSNWYSDPGASGGCCCAGTAGTPAGRLPTTADTVIIIGVLITPYSGGNWSGPVQFFSTVNAGTFSGDVMLQSSGNIAGGTYNTGTITSYAGIISGGTFNGPINLLGTLNISGGTFNGAITGTGVVPFGSIALVISGGTFNTAIPSGLNSYTITGGTFDRDLVLGTNARLTAVNLNFTTSRNITIDISYFYFNSFQNRNLGGYFTVGGGNYTGLISITKSVYTNFEVTGGTYAPPAVSTPAIKSGNNMTFNSAVIPTDWGFKTFGTFSPTINLTGTSNEILGAGLI